MAELDTADRDKLRSTQFAYVDRDGGEHLPINDASHVRNAISRFNQTEFESVAAKERARQQDPRRGRTLRHRGRRGLEDPQAGKIAPGRLHQARPAGRAQGLRPAGPVLLWHRTARGATREHAARSGPPTIRPWSTAVAGTGWRAGCRSARPFGSARRSRPRGHCRRCGGDRRLILDDGPPICRTCVMAWVWLARAITSGETIAEPHIATMRHAEHLRPHLGCPLCGPWPRGDDWAGSTSGPGPSDALKRERRRPSVAGQGATAGRLGGRPSCCSTRLDRALVRAERPRRPAGGEHRQDEQADDPGQDERPVGGRGQRLAPGLHRPVDGVVAGRPSGSTPARARAG